MYPEEVERALRSLLHTAQKLDPVSLELTERLPHSVTLKVFYPDSDGDPRFEVEVTETEKWIASCSEIQNLKTLEEDGIG